MITLLFEVGHLYHRAALDPLYQVFRQDPQYDIAFACSHDAERRFGLFNHSLRSELEARFRAEGLTIAEDTRGFDVVITGDTVREPQRYGRMIVVVARPAIDDDVRRAALRREEWNRGSGIDRQRRSERDDQIGGRSRFSGAIEIAGAQRLAEADRRRFQ